MTIRAHLGGMGDAVRVCLGVKPPVRGVGERSSTALGKLMIKATPDAFDAALDRLFAVAKPHELRQLTAHLAPESAEFGGIWPQFRTDCPPALLTQDQLAKALGCSVRSVFTLRDRGCPHLMLLESPRFVLANVIRWMETRSMEHAA